MLAFLLFLEILMHEKLLQRAVFLQKGLLRMGAIFILKLMSPHAYKIHNEFILAMSQTINISRSTCDVYYRVYFCKTMSNVKLKVFSFKNMFWTKLPSHFHLISRCYEHRIMTFTPSCKISYYITNQTRHPANKWWTEMILCLRIEVQRW